MLNDYTGNDNYGKLKSEYISKIAAMTDKQLLKETKDKIWLSAYASNNPRSDYHWQCDACYDEWKENRKDKYGYDQAYKAVLDANFR